MENDKGSKTASIGSDKIKTFLYYFLNKKDKELEQQELYKFLIRDNFNHMLIVSVLLMLISIVKVVARIDQSGYGDVSIFLILITLAYVFLWYFVHTNLAEELKAQKIIYLSFWFFISLVCLKGLYSEIIVYHTILYYYLLMYLLTGFYIGSFIDIIFFIGLDTSVAIIILNNSSRIDINIKLYTTVTIIVAIICFVIMTTRYYHYVLEKKAQISIRTVGGVDRLTNLLNRRGFDEKIAKMWTQWSDIRREIIGIMIDIDYFKSYNDTYGHIAGDQCLKDISECIYDIASRKTDLIVRYGGEEIVVVLNNQSEEESIEIACNIQERINSCNIKSGEAAIYPYVTVSMGVASMVANPNNSIYDLIEKADEQLYFSKKAGRNRITMNNICVELNKVKAANIEVTDVN